MKMAILRAATVFAIGACLTASNTFVTCAEENTKTDSTALAGVAVDLDKALVSSGNNVDVNAIIESVKLDMTTAAQETAAEEEQTTEELAIQSVISGYTNLGVANVDNYLNVRAQADASGEIIGKLPAMAGCEIIEELDGWYKVQSGDITGYVAAEYILTGEAANAQALISCTKVATVNTETLYVRMGAGTENKILTLVPQGEVLDVVEELDGWIKIMIDEDEGYVSSEFVDISMQLPQGMAVEEVKSSESVSNIRAEIVAYAKQFLGNPYVWGGTSLTNGADCSGFVQSIYRQFGYSISRTSSAQSSNGTRVGIYDVQPGDLLFYSNEGNGIDHVAMYIGNGLVIHASNPQTGIKISNAYYRTPVTAVSIIGD